MEVAKDLWASIRERFSVFNGSNIQQLKVELAEYEQKSMIIDNYYEKLTKFWEELANFEQILTCKFGKCMCDLGVVLEKKREEDKVNLFLIRLDETLYGTVRPNLIAQGLLEIGTMNG